MTKQRNLFFWKKCNVFPVFATLESRSPKTERDEHHSVLIKKRKLKSSHQRENDLGDEVRLIWILRSRTFSLRKHPILLALHRCGRFARNVHSDEERGETDVFAG